jgi:hypothetical protein
MRWIVSGFALALALSAPAAFAQTKTPNVSGAPSAQNSGAGIAGQPGNKNGPAMKPGAKGTVGSSMNNPQNPAAVQQQDSSKVKGMRGNKNGPPAKY